MLADVVRVVLHINPGGIDIVIISAHTDKTRIAGITVHIVVELSVVARILAILIVARIDIRQGIVNGPIAVIIL